MEAASGMISAQKYLTKLVDGSDSEQNSINQLDEFFAAVAKIEIVGTNETIEKFDSVLRQFNESHFSLLSEALKINNIEDELRVMKEEIEFKYETYDRTVTLLINGQIEQDPGFEKLNHDIFCTWKER